MLDTGEGSSALRGVGRQPSQLWVTRGQVVGLILLLAVALRFPGLWTDFWLDEIWSWTLVWDWRLTRRVTGIWGIFTEVHQDNNNYLNTLFIYLCGPSAPLAVYRIPAFVAGGLAVWIGGLLAVRWSQPLSLDSVTATLVGMGLLATSQIEVVYSSEARGYSIAICAAFAAQWYLGSLLRSDKWLFVVGYAFSAGCGFLGHLSFLPVFVAQAVWSLAALIWARHSAGSWQRMIGKLFVAFGIPTLVVGWLWLVDLSQARVGGGPQLSPWMVIRDFLAMPFGASLPQSVSVPCGLLMLALVACGLWRLRRTATLEVVGLVSLTIVAPAIMFGLAPKGLVYPRHFLVSMSLLIPVAGMGLWSWCAADRKWLRLAGFAAVGVWCLGNGSEIVRFWIAGRGQYQAALDHISAGTSGRLTPIGSDNDFRTSMVMSFYQARFRKYRPLRYAPQEIWGQLSPHWILLHSFDRDPNFVAEFEVAGFRYQLDAVFPYAGPVGWHWAAYYLSGPVTP